jgi:histidinol-phosphate aminotransferase
LTRLAIESYRGKTLADDDNFLNLSWTSDEREYLRPDVRELLVRGLRSEIADELTSVQRYAVDDPYGEELLTQGIRAYFGIPLDRTAVAAGAGVISLLHALATWAAAGTAYVIGEVYPDLPHWVERGQGRSVGGDARLPVDEHARRVDDAGATLIFLERPSLTGDDFAHPDSLRALCEVAAARGIPLVVDESNANYWPPSFSAAGLAAAVDSLVVLRGFSKAYSLGGLRLGYAIASEALRRRLHATVPPLLASSLSLKLGTAILHQGDMGEALRCRMEAPKAMLAEFVAAVGLTGATPSSRYLPYVLVPGEPAAVTERLQAHGVVGKRHMSWSAESGTRSIHRLSAPLRPNRVDRLHTALLRAQDRRGNAARPG